MPMTSKEMIKLVQKNGFVIERSNGSHHFLRNPKTGKTTTVPFHTKDLKTGTKSKILKDAGIK